MLQAAILNRALFETLATVLTLTEKPAERAQILMRESIKMFAVNYKHLVARFGHDPKWKDYLDVYQKGQTIIAKEHELPLEVFDNPDSIQDEWPTPGRMLWRRKRPRTPPFISGSRHAVLKELYESHYAHQSAQAHARMATVSIALLIFRMPTTDAARCFTLRIRLGNRMICGRFGARFRLG